MANLTIRNVPASSKERLRLRAARNGRSMESELRAILNAALDSDADGSVNLAEAIRRRFAPFGGVELEEHPPELVGQPPDMASDCSRYERHF